MGIFIVIFMFASWSSVFSLGKYALENSPPVFLTAFRMLVGGFILLVWIYFKDKKCLKISKQEVVPIIFLSIFSIYLTNILEMWGLQHLSAAKACFIYGLSPFFSLILSYIHFSERLSIRKILGMFIGFLGFIPVLCVQTGSEDLLLSVSFVSWAEIAIMAAAFFSVYGWVLLRILTKKMMTSPLCANGYSMLLGGVLACMHSFFVDNWAPLPVKKIDLYPFFQSIFIIILVSNILCYNLYGFMLKRYTATFLAFIGLLSPIFASIISWVFLKEEISWIIFVSTVIVSFGLFLVYQSEIKLGYIRRDVNKNFA